jgi:hypothetical protein
MGDLDLDGSATPAEGAMETNRGDNMETTSRDSKIDWEKVGKIYKPESAMQTIIDKEMKRLQMAFDTKLENQDEEMIKNKKK